MGSEMCIRDSSTDDSDPDEILLIDAHDREVCKEVWSLFEYTLELGGVRPSLIEWDNSVPALQTLLSEMKKADSVAHQVSGVAHVASH